MGQTRHAAASTNLDVMQRIFHPKAIAVVGASATPGKLGYAVVSNLIAGGYRGQIYPVNPSGQDILGLKVHKSLQEIPQDLDMVVVAVPASMVPAIIPQAAARKAAGMLIISSGFAETGNADLQAELVRAARSHNLCLIGPNTYGYYYTQEGLCATFCTPYTERGGVALVSQSGGVGMAILGYSRDRRMGVSAIVGLGNKADIGETELLEFFQQDPNTQVVGIHMEDLKDGRAFMQAAQRITQTKPVVVLKSGRTESGARAAASHTAAMAGQDKVYEAAFTQSGVIRARTLEELMDWSRALQMLPDPAGENVVIITGAGGLGVLLADACTDYGIHLMSLPPDVERMFAQFIPPFGSLGNPVDITGGEPPETYYRCILAALMEPRINSLIIGYWHTVITPPMVFAETLGRAVAEAQARGVRKPVVAALAGDVEVSDAARYLEERGIPAYPYAAEKAAAALSAKYQFWRYRQKSGREVLEKEPGRRTKSGKKGQLLSRLIERASGQGRAILTEVESKELIAEAGIPVVESRAATSRDEAVSVARALGFPVVLKVLSPDITHKSDAGGVRVGLSGDGAVAAAYDDIMRSAHMAQPTARIQGVSVQRMASPGVEVIIGGFRDPRFGPVVMFGLGGVLVEVFKDVCFRIAPLSPQDAREMVCQIRGYSILQGVRGQPAVDTGKLEQAILAVSVFLEQNPQVQELDLNPVFAYPDGLLAVDARVSLAVPAPTGK